MPPDPVTPAGAKRTKRQPEVVPVVVSEAEDDKTDASGSDTEADEVG